MAELRQTYTAEPEVAGMRLDQALARAWREHSRSRIAGWIRAGAITVDGRQVAPDLRLCGHEEVRLVTTLSPCQADQPEALPFPVLHEDGDVVVVDKPAGLSVHPGAGSRSGTLVNALLHRYPETARLPRAGLVHRLDKDTTGCLLVARTPAALTLLTAELAARRVKRQYEAVVVGIPVAGGVIDVPLARDPKHRTRFAPHPGGKPARTHFRVVQRFSAHALLALELETGRTHQIRVHLAHAGFPLVGDPAYGGRFRRPAGASEALVATLRTFGRQALHARQIGFRHPRHDQWIEMEAPRPADFTALLAALRADDDRSTGD